jgi:hypothetical protein
MKNFYRFLILFFLFILFIIARFFGRLMPKNHLRSKIEEYIALSLKNFLQSQTRHLNFQDKNQMMFEKFQLFLE